MNKETNNLQLAPISRRFFAFLIDEFIVTILVYFIFWDKLIQTSSDMNLLADTLASLMLPVLIIKFVYQSLFVWYYGATIGKILLKIRVIKHNDFGRVSLFTSIIRSICRIISEYFIYMGFMVAFLTQGRQAFHDKLAKTLVINA